MECPQQKPTLGGPHRETTISGSARQVALARKLLETLHLNNDERDELADGTLCRSVALAALTEALTTEGVFPAWMRNADGPFDGIWLERRPDGSIWAHEQFEVGVNRFSEVRTIAVSSPDDGLDRYLARRVVNGGIDGVPFNPKA